MYLNRLESVYKHMERDGLHQAIISDKNALFYLFGSHFESGERMIALLLRSNMRPIFILNDLFSFSDKDVDVIYYNDSEYGKLRIVAMSSTIPCGSIIRINVDAYDPDGMYAIVLDRGVSGNMVDLLKPSARSSSPVQTVNNVTFDIVRYGY